MSHLTPSPTPTETPTPSATPTATHTPLPTPEPAGEWNGVPIMPGAWGRRDIGGTLTYTVAASLIDVHAFYQREMVDLGWRATSELISDDGSFAMFVFEKDKLNVGVSVSAMASQLSFVTLGLY